MKKQRLAAPVILSIISLTVLLYVIVATNTNEKLDIVRRLVITGNAHLDSKQYLAYVGNDSLNASRMDLPELRKKLLAHPYIKDAAVRRDGSGAAVAAVTEKVMKALVLAGEKEYYLTEFDELVPLRFGTQPVDVPVVRFPSRETGGLGEAQRKKIRSAILFLNATCVDNLNFAGDVSEIILEDDGVLLVSLKSLKPFFIMNDKDIEHEAAYLLSLKRAESEYAAIIGGCTYFDMRLKQKIVAVSLRGTAS